MGMELETVGEGELNRADELRKYSELIGDEYTLKILAATFIRPKGTQELSLKYDIPIAACYRRVRTLEKLGLLKCVDRILTQRGKWVRRYKSCVRNISVFFERGKLKVHLDLTTCSESLNGLWDVLSAE